MSWRYAVGEVILIVAGVSLALMANSWYENWQEARYESQALQQINDALESDLEYLHGRFQELKGSEQILMALLDKLQSEVVLAADSEADFQSVIMWRGMRVRSGPYEELKNRGLSIVSDDMLRLSLIDLYENRFSALQGVTANDQIFSRDQVLPFFYRNFRRVDYQKWSPIDGYQELDNDPYFENLVAAKPGSSTTRSGRQVPISL